MVKKLPIYDPEELNFVLNKFVPDIVQAPFNIVDRRLEKNGWLEVLNKQNIEIHVRSVFLQGLLLLDSKKRPKNLLKYKKFWKDWDNWLISIRLSPLKACLAFCNSYELIDKFIVGVDSFEQFKEILNSSKSQLDDFPDYLSQTDNKLINPSWW